ncbi:MAG: ArsR family transcriptional regulator [Stappia sp.]|nr:ArsR family transcriptional regulator [Stappia sp.]MBM21920.1 ArsR family transcriptional regulator [Stappia sp.]
MLIAALVGPFLVDWTAYRSTFERYGEQVLGHRVEVMGEAEMRLLPTPTLTFTDVRVGEPEDALLVISRFSMRVELPPLLKGEVRVIDMTMDQPTLQLAVDEQGRLDWFTALRRSSLIDDLDPDLVMLEQATIRDGRFLVTDARSGRTHSIEDVDVTVAARSLKGPFRVDGMATVDGERATVLVSTGRADAQGGIRVRAGITPVATPVDLVADGRMSIEDGRPAYEGNYTISSVTPEEEAAQAWTSEGAFAFGNSRLDLTEARFSYGPQERPVSLDGTMSIVLDAPYRFELKATAKQIDLDRISGRGPQSPLSAVEAGGLVLETLQSLPHPPFDGTVSLTVPGVISGGGLIQNLLLDAERLASGWRLERLSAQLPGRSEFLARGDLEIAPRAAFRGSFAVSVAQPNLFADWWRRGEASSAAGLPFALDARISATEEEVALTQMSFEIGDAPGRGTFSYRPAGEGSARVRVDVDAERLDADQVGLLARLFLNTAGEGGKPVGSGAAEISARLFAQSVAIGALEARNATLIASYADDGLDIEALSVGDLAGAKVEASGTISDLSSVPTGDLSATVDADRLEGVTGLLARIWPDARFLQAFQARAQSLAPTRLALTFHGEADGTETRASIKASGEAGGTAIDLSGGLEGRLDTWREAQVDMTGGLGNPDGGKLLAQLGFPVLPLSSLGDGRIEISLAGRPASALEGSTRLYLGDAMSLSAVGSLSLPIDADASYSAELEAGIEDVTLLALLSGRLPALTASSGAAELVAKLDGAGDAFTVRDLSGRLAGAAVDGSLDVDLRLGGPDLPPRIRGKLSTSQFDVLALSDLVLGTDPLADAGPSGWSTSPFGPSLVPPMDLALDISATRLSLSDLPELSGASGRLSLSSDAMALDLSEAGVSGGRLSGSFGVKRIDGQASISGSVKVEDAALEEFVWTRNARAVAKGTVDVGLDFDGTGRSLSAVVASLAGGATLQVRDGEIRGLNPNAFGLVIRAADAGLTLDDENVREAFLSHLDAGVLPFSTLEASGAIAGGVLRVNTLRLDTPSASVFGGAQVDLSQRRLSSEISLKVDPGEDAVTGAEPQVGLVFSGPLDAPERQIDIAPFTAYLTLRAFEQEVQRVEKLQAEIAERERRMRELRKQKDDEQRRERERLKQEERDRQQLKELQERQERQEQEDARKAREKEEAARLAAEKAAEEKAAAERAAAERARRQRDRDRVQATPRPMPATPAETFGDRIRRALTSPEPDGAGTGAQGEADREQNGGAPLRLLPLDPPVFVGTTPDR